MSNRKPDLQKEKLLKNAKIGCGIIVLLIIAMGIYGTTAEYLEKSRYLSERRKTAEGIVKNLTTLYTTQEMVNGIFKEPITNFPDLREKLLIHVLNSERWPFEVIEPAIIQYNFSPSELELIVKEFKTRNLELQYPENILYAMTMKPDGAASHFAFYFSNNKYNLFKQVLARFLDDSRESGNISHLNKLRNWKKLFPSFYNELNVEERLKDFADASNGLSEIIKEQERLKKEKGNLEIEISEIGEALKKILILKAYVIGEVYSEDGFVYYEIAFIDRDFYSGERISKTDRAFLATKNTRFSSQGKFTMYVVKGPNMKHKLNMTTVHHLEPACNIFRGNALALPESFCET